MEKEKKYNCEDCHDRGEVSFAIRTLDGNWEEGVGTRPCHCTKNNDDFSGATKGDR